MITEGGFRVPTLAATAGSPNITERLKNVKSFSGQDIKVHLDGYDQIRRP